MNGIAGMRSLKCIVPNMPEASSRIRLGVFGSALFVVAACTDQHPTALATASTALAMHLIVSAPSPGALVYVSLPPTSLSGGSSATIRNSRTRDSINVSMVEGGFDPAPIQAMVDDYLTIAVHEGTSTELSATIKVPRRRPPAIVRSEPASGKIDVELKALIEVIFSEPVKQSTVTAGMRLDRAGELVAGVATLNTSGLVAEFAPSVMLAPNTSYALFVTSGVRNLAGDAMQQSARVNFTTGAGSPEQPTEPLPGPGTSCDATSGINSAATVGTFTLVGSMSQIHSAMTTLLPDGRVVVFGATPFNASIWGGVPDTTIRPVAEVYDPVTETFSPADQMVTFRGGHPAVLLPPGNLRFLDGTPLQDGRVFFAGSKSAELYDPATGTFMPTGNYAHAEPFAWTTRTLLLDGRVLLTGIVGTPPFSGATELFDPKTGTFKITGDMHGWSDTPGLGILLADGSVLFVQWNFDFSGDVAEIYDPTTEHFTTVGCLYAHHEYSAGVRLHDGTILISGGQLPGGDGSTETLLYLPAVRKFVEGPAMNVGRHSHSATLLLDGTILITGGYGTWPTPTRTAEVFRVGP